MDATHFGAVLRGARERREMTLPSVAERTKIPIHALRLIEGGRIEELPAEVFVRGFIRSYARAVGVPEGEPLGLYDQALAERRRIEQSQMARPAPTDLGGDAMLVDDEAALPRRGIGLAVFVIIVLIIATITLSLFLRQPPESGERLSLRTFHVPHGGRAQGPAPGRPGFDA